MAAARGCWSLSACPMLRQQSCRQLNIAADSAKCIDAGVQLGWRFARAEGGKGSGVGRIGSTANRENSENISEFSGFRGVSAPVCKRLVQQFQGAGCKFPVQRNRDLNSPERGFDSRRTGRFIRGNRDPCFLDRPHTIHPGSNYRCRPPTRRAASREEPLDPLLGRTP